MTQQKEASNTKMNGWVKDAYHDDEMTIHDFLELFCKKLSSMFDFSEVKLSALRNDDIIDLYNSCNDETKRISHSIKSPKYSEQSTVLIEHGDKYSVFIYIPVYNKPRYIVHVIACSQHSDVYSSLQSLTEQVILMVRLKEERRINLIHKNLVREFFASNMDADEAWNILSRCAVKFLPDTYPFNAGAESLAQVLTYSKNDKYLVLRANQEDNNVGKKYTDEVSLPLKLKVDETVCGILIENNWEYLNTNPAEKYPDRYQAYLFANHVAKSELVFPIRQQEGNIVAIINFEHKEQNVFSGYSVESMRRAVDMLEPFVIAIIQKEKTHKNREISLLYITTEIIQRMSSLYRHKIGSKLLISRMIINKFKDKYLDDVDFQKDLTKLNTNINDFNTASSGFLRDLPNYMKSRDILLVPVIRRAKNDLDSEKLKQGDGININIDAYSSDIVVYASDMLKEHFYNLLNNSVLAIKQRISEGKQIGGAINITITRKIITDTINIKNNTSPSRIYISIVDNGGGVSTQVIATAPQARVVFALGQHAEKLE